VDSGGGYPTCRQWWSDGGSGLRARLLAQVDPDLLTRIGRWAGFLSQSEVNDSVIRAVVSPRQQKMNQGSVYTDYGGQIEKTLPNVVTRGAGDLGLTMGSLGFFPAMDVVRQALPMVLSLLKMALVICIPLVLVFGTYELKALVAVSCVQFALFFVDFWFQLARWLDSTILDALYGWGFGANRPHSNFDPLIGLNNAFGDMLLNFVMATMFIVLPTFWVAALGWVGVRAGTAIQGLAAGTRMPKLLAAGCGCRHESSEVTPLGLLVFWIVGVDPVIVMGVEAVPGRAVSPFRLVFLVVAPIVVADYPGADQRERKQQCQPERGVEQDTDRSELDGQQRGLGNARRPSLREQPALRPPIQTRAAPRPAQCPAEAFCEGGLCGGLHGGYLMFILSCGCDPVRVAIETCAVLQPRSSPCLLRASRPGLRPPAPPNRPAGCRVPTSSRTPHRGRTCCPTTARSARR
jgi:hypothetical protein